VLGIILAAGDAAICAPTDRPRRGHCHRNRVWCAAGRDSSIGLLLLARANVDDGGSDHHCMVSRRARIGVVYGAEIFRAAAADVRAFAGPGIAGASTSRLEGMLNDSNGSGRGRGTTALERRADPVSVEA